MGVNRWTPEQWRAYNRLTGDRHVNRRLPPISARRLFDAEDVPQVRALARLERRRNVEAIVDAERRRERQFLAVTRTLVDER